MPYLVPFSKAGGLIPVKEIGTTIFRSRSIATGKDTRTTPYTNWKKNILSAQVSGRLQAASMFTAATSYDWYIDIDLLGVVQ